MSELRLFLETISKIENLTILNTTKTDDIKIIKIMNEYNLDFDDGLNYYLVKKYNLKGIVSYDKHFDKTDIKRY
ncbi:PIN domain-containing protein [Caldisericum sp.]|uniref:PIN domain-containing protein n=1 Tax=Caldisericum sp. TaxID=2499687 RepID=UPI003D12D7B1